MIRRHPLSVVVWLAGAVLAAAQDSPPRPVAPNPPERPPAQRGATAGLRISVGYQQGQRTITYQTDEEKVQILESQEGKNIVLRHERKVNGETKKDEYKAPDLDALKKQHPDAAELYRKVTQQAPVRPVPQAPIIAPNALPQFGFGGSMLPGPGSGVRRIVATVKGSRVSIEDQYGSRIKMSVSRRIDGKDDTETYSAADVTMLKKEHPEIGALYQRLTGTN